MKAKLRAVTATALLGLLLSLPQLALSQEAYEKPTALAMGGDLLIARPALLAITAVGAVGFVASIIFTAAGGNIGEAADTLVVKPGEATFVRCLGCRTGRKSKMENSVAANY
jgi:hypothetical protein